MAQIKELRQAKGITQDELGTMLGVQKAAISKYERGLVPIPQRHIESMCNIFGVSADELLGRSAVRRTYEEPETSEEHPPCETRYIPLLGRVHAGDPMFSEENISEYIPHSASDTRNGDYFYMEVVGDCMTGDYIPEGAQILVEKTSGIHSGQVAVVRVGDEVVLRRVKFMQNCIVLIPSNPHYEPMILSGENGEDIEIIGRVHEVRFTVW